MPRPMHPLLRFFDQAYLVRLFLVLLVPATAMLADGLLLITLAERFGRYLAVAITGVTGLCGLFFLINALSTTLRTLHQSVGEGRYPHREYQALAALVVSAILLLTPGLFTDALGVLFFLPPLRRPLGALVIRPVRGELREVYEYLKMR